ncbi:MAG: LicD family protein [Clostridia bacterium]|nr:LicD family protein [Clostridia bacterium]
MNELQSKLVEMLSWYHNFCVEHGLRYYAAGGTALGAVRHKGFIPWDDDIDVVMPRPDYEKFKELSASFDADFRYRAEFPNQNKDFVYQYGKLYDTTTTLIESTRFKTKRGIFIDIFPIDGAGNTREEALEHLKDVFKKINLLSAYNCAIRKGRKFYKNAAVVAMRCVPRFILNPKKISEKAEDMCRSVSYDDSKFVANLVGLGTHKEIMEREWMGTPTIAPFENVQIYCPEFCDKYLTQLFGDYMKLPPEEKRVSHHEFLSYDLDKSYLSE